MMPGDEDGFGLARSTDHQTSRIAADKAVRSGRVLSGRRRVRECYYAEPGLTAKEIEERTGVSWKRVSDEITDGYAYRGPDRMYKGELRYTVWPVLQPKTETGIVQTIHTCSAKPATVIVMLDPIADRWVMAVTRRTIAITFCAWCGVRLLPKGAEDEQPRLTL